jgi:hypothetical protein
MKKLVGAFAVLLCVCTAMMHSADNLPRQPVVVAKLSFKGQTASIPMTTLFTPTQGGVYRVSAYVESSNFADTYFPEVFLSWTDDFVTNPTQQMIGSLGNSGNAAWNSLQLTVRDIANQPIQFSTVESPNEQGICNFYFVVEQL